jgi:hypothetical protein
MSQRAVREITGGGDAVQVNGGTFFVAQLSAARLFDDTELKVSDLS